MSFNLSNVSLKGCIVQSMQFSNIDKQCGSVRVSVSCNNILAFSCFLSRNGFNN